MNVTKKRLAELLGVHTTAKDFEVLASLSYQLNKQDAPPRGLVPVDLVLLRAVYPRQGFYLMLVNIGGALLEKSFHRDVREPMKRFAEAASELAGRTDPNALRLCLDNGYLPLVLTPQTKPFNAAP